MIVPITKCANIDRNTSDTVCAGGGREMEVVRPAM